jgi:glycosyltransferase involved in cell wall biosynthesis
MKSVVIPTYNHCNDFLKPLCESIIKYTDLVDIEIIIVANGCTDNTREYVTSLGSPFKLVWFDEGLGFTIATNQGVKASSGDIIIFMNNDCLLLPQPKNTWINYLCNPLKDQIGLTCNLKLWDASVERYFGVFFLAATTRSIWNKIGGLDESWSPGGGEDIEFCLKVEQLGYKILQVPNENNEIINGINVNTFPNYHLAEGTFMDDEHKEMWQKHMSEVRKKLEFKYKLPKGWFYEKDIEEYRRLVEDLPDNAVMCELGCYKGRSLCSVADIIKRKNINVFVVDNFTGTSSEGNCESDFQEEFEINCKRFGINPYIFSMSTDEANKQISQKFDLIFIDADHEEKAFKKDLTNWLNKLKYEGTIAGHDYGNHIGISKVVNDFFNNVRVYGSVWSKRL